MNKIKRIISLMVAGTLTLGAPAVPATLRVIIVKQPNGQLLHIRLCGDEHAHFTMTEDSVLLAQDGNGYYCYAERINNAKAVAGKYVAHDASLRTPSERTVVGQLRNAGLLEEARASIGKMRQRFRHHLMGYPNVPPTGAFKGLVILANFKDCKFTEGHTQPQMERMLNENGYSDNGASGSVRDYYLAQSYGKFNPNFDVVGPVELSNGYAYYGNDYPTQDANAQLMIKEACQLAHEKGVDFSQYDNNGDGYVDMVYVIYAGYSQSNGASTNTIWPHMSYLKTYSNQLDVDGVTVNCYATGGELAGASGEDLMGIGLICHEFTHTLGIPDLYDTSTSSPKIFGMGTWDVMANGCYNNNSHTPAGYSSYEKTTLGWLTPTKLNEPHQGFTLKNLGDNPEALRFDNPNNPDEYFLVENRSKNNLWDSALPGEGMLVLDVRYDSAKFDQNLVNANNDYHVRIIPANGVSTPATEGASVAFPGANIVKAFTPLSSPASIFSDGTELNCPITDISYDGSEVHFDYGQKPATPLLEAESNFSDNSFRLNWSKVPDAKYYQVCVTDVTTGDSTVYSKILRNRFTLGNIHATHTYTCKVRSEGTLAYSDWSTPHVVTIAASGVASLEADDVMRPNAAYFHIDGTNATATHKGLIIVREGNKVTKKIIR